MMRFTDNSSVKTKLRFIILLTSSISLLFVFLSFFLYDALQTQQHSREELRAMAEIIAKNAAITILFNDPEAALHQLNALKNKPDIFAAYIITKDNRILAKYVEKNTNKSHLKLESSKSSDLVDPLLLSALKNEAGKPWDFDLDHEVTIQAMHDNENLGTVVIQAHAIDTLWPKMKGFLIIAALFLTIALIISYLISERLQRLISDPILRLSRTMKDISETKNYAVRVENKSDDEVGMLYEGFNMMLSGIQERDLKLAETHENLNEEITKRTKALKEWRTTFDAAKEMILVLDNNLTIMRANAAFSSFVKKPFHEIIGRPLKSFFAETDFFSNNSRLLINSEGPIPEKEMYLPESGKWINISISVIQEYGSSPGSAVFIIRDITDIKKSQQEQGILQEQLLQMQKMDSIGRLAGGIAHDFNNILASIMGYCELSLPKLPEDSRVRDHLNTIYESGKKAAALTRQLLLFSRKQPMEMKTVNLNVVIGSMSKMFSRLLGENIIFSVNTHEALNNTLADISQIEQVLMNLVVNARDAMPGGGTIRIRTDNVNSTAGNYPDLQGKPLVLLEVSDTGEGMSSEIREKIFDPFFTTKEMGKGTGLGLATVYGIVTSHKGCIEVESEPQKGSSFRIYLPATDIKTQEIITARQTLALNGTECILVAEDDEQLRELTSSILEQAGYSVIVAADGQEAVVRFMENSHKIQLVLLDMLMPGENGREAYRNMKAVQPGIRALFMSGYTADIISDNGILEEGIELIHKPISNEELLMKIRQKLDA